MLTDRKTALALLLFDAIATVVAFNIIGHYRGVTDHFVLAPLFGPLIAVVLGAYLVDGYQARTDMMSLEYTCLHVIALVTAMLASLLLTFVFTPEGYELQSSRAVLVLSFLALVPLTLSYRRLLYEQTANRRSRQNLIFIGDPTSCEAFSEECLKMGTLQPVVLAALESGGDGGSPALEEVIRSAREGAPGIEAIVLRESGRDLPPRMLEQLLQVYFSGVPTYTLELFHEVYWQKIPLYRINPIWLFQEGFSIAREPVFERLKRVSDIVFAVVGLVLATPLLLLASLAIFIEDRGPVFFVQSRVGKNRALFRIVKLRTMHAGGGGDLYTRPGDARITRAGRVLRTSRLDELPQLWNVLRGDMSLIGPRAEWDRLVDQYERQIPCYEFRHLVKPGITGWAQVKYLYGSNLEDTVRKLEYDLYYIRHFSFTLDASIVLKTVQVMLFGKGR
jgi:exopolysaccharide biosynthesis polyprenyl glycosylphosphotransferase